MKLIPLAFLLMLSPSVPAWSQAAPPAFISQIGNLSAESQAIVKELKFGDFEAAPLNTRQLTYIKAVMRITNTSSRQSIVGTLRADMRLLFRTQDKEWYVLKCGTGEFDIGAKGVSDVQLSFRETNRKIESLTGNRTTMPEAAFLQIQYEGAAIYESPIKNTRDLPPRWWEKEGTMGAAPATDSSAAIPDIPELKSLRKQFGSRLRVTAVLPFEKAVTELRQRYVQAIDRAIQKSQSEGKLDEALELKAEKEKIAQDPQSPLSESSSFSPPLASLRSIYRDSYQKAEAQQSSARNLIGLQYEKEVLTLIARLTRDGKLEEAKSVRDSKDIPLEPVL